MSNSKLIEGTLLTNNCTSPRNHKIDCIVPHFMEWYATARECCESFVPAKRRASANYCIGRNGEIWLNVEEKNRAWTTGNSIIDNRAITIECANYMDTARFGKLPDATWDSLVRLCVDICQRNGIEKINYTGDKTGNLHMHMWYQDTNCPGPWLSTQFGQLASQINRLLGQDPDPTPTHDFGGKYLCTVYGLRVRTAPSFNGLVVAEYNKGDFVYLDDWYKIHDGYVWGKYTGSTSGQYRYVAVGRATGKPETNDYLIKV